MLRSTTLSYVILLCCVQYVAIVLVFIFLGLFFSLWSGFPEPCKTLLIWKVHTNCLSCFYYIQKQVCAFSGLQYYFSLPSSLINFD